MPRWRTMIAPAVTSGRRTPSRRAAARSSRARSSTIRVPSCAPSPASSFAPSADSALRSRPCGSRARARTPARPRGSGGASRARPRRSERRSCPRTPSAGARCARAPRRRRPRPSSAPRPSGGGGSPSWRPSCVRRRRSSRSRSASAGCGSRCGGGSRCASCTCRPDLLAEHVTDHRAVTVDVGSRSVVPFPPTSRTRGLNVLPSSVGSRSTSNRSPSWTRYCFPPTAMIARGAGNELHFVHHLRRTSSATSSTGGTSLCASSRDAACRNRPRPQFGVRQAAPQAAPARTKSSSRGPSCPMMCFKNRIFFWNSIQ